MDELGLTQGELRRVTRACRHVRATPGLLPLLKPFLACRLAGRPRLAGKVGRLDRLGEFRLWEVIKDTQGRRARAAPRPPRRRAGLSPPFP